MRISLPRFFVKVFRADYGLLFLGVVLGGLLGLQESPAYGQTNPVTITVQPAVSPDTLNSYFNGLSYEKSNVSTPLYSVNDTALIGLYTQLGPGVIRIGGNSADTMTWNPTGPGLVANVVSPPDIQRLAGFMNATNWKLIYALNLGTGTPAAAAAEAAYVSSALGSSLLGFEIGNEPGSYSTNGIRPSTYTFADFQAEWQTFADAIQAETPSAPLIGPADTSFTPAFMAALGSQVVLVTDHYYDGTGNGGNDLSALLTPNAYTVDTLLPSLDSLSAAVSVPWRMGECNAFSKPPVPADEFAEALWGIDFEFANALYHSSGVNFHAVIGESPIDTNGTTVTQVNPLYYGMKLFSMAANGTFVATAVSAQQSTLSAYAVAANNGSTYVILNNKDPQNAVAATIDYMQPVASATATVLTAPSLTSTSGVTLGGVTIGTNGSWTPPAAEQATVSGGAASFTVPAGSAAFIEALPVTTSIGIPYDRLCAQSSNNTSVGPYFQQSTCNVSSSAQAFAFVPTSNGFFNIVPQNSDLCMDWQTPNTTALQTVCAQSLTQQWTVEPNPAGTYFIMSSNGQYCLNVHDSATYLGNTIGTWNCNGQPNEEFTLSNPPNSPLQTSSSTMKVSYDGLCMDVNLGTLSVGPYIRQHSCNGTANQSWAFSSTVDGYYTINSNGSKLCLDGATPNSAVIQNTCTGGISQKWQLEHNSDNTYTLAGDGSGNCLGISGASTTANALFMVYACDGGSDQKLNLATPPAKLVQP